MLDYISSLPSERQRSNWPRTLVILGSTGSIGRSALEVLRLQKDRFRVAALAGARNITLLAKQAEEFRPPHLGVLEKEDVPKLRGLLPSGYSPAIVYGQEGYEALARLPSVSTLLSAQSGAAGLRATFAGVETGKIIALANKESLVLAGSLIREACKRSGACILPVDSEHNALFQCLADSLSNIDRKLSNGDGAGLSRLILTASGGPFFGWSKDRLAQVTVEQALDHPNWRMGAKITIDSATLMNKGLELMEARHLYGLPMSSIEVLVHPESIIHSLVEFSDGTQLAQLSKPDMRIPIAYCLGWPERLGTGAERLDLASIASLTFSRPDLEAFPCLALARRAQEESRGCPVVLNAANEEAVAAFLDRQIPFMSIPDLVEHCLDDYLAGRYSEHAVVREPEDIEAVLALDAETRIRACERVRQTLAH